MSMKNKLTIVIDDESDAASAFNTFEWASDRVYMLLASELTIDRITGGLREIIDQTRLAIYG